MPRLLPTFVLVLLAANACAPEPPRVTTAPEHEVGGLEETADIVAEEAETDTVESAFDSNQWNTAIGGGRDAGGKWGGRARAGRPQLDSVAGATAAGESYEAVAENAFRLAAQDPVSTFGVDVDRASYTNVRRMLAYGKLPPAAAVRVEEMINYFSYDYPQPEGKDAFSVTTELAACPWNPAHRLALIGLQGRTIPADRVPPRNLVFLVDCSGSMGSPDKLPLVKRALKTLVSGLGDKDTVAVVTYAGATGVALPPTRCQDTAPVLACIDGLGAGGSTNGAGGIRAAYDLARRSYAREHLNRVVLITDGDFNVGVSSDAELRKLIETERESGVYLTTVGVGSGNLQDSKLSTLAKHGNGQYLYLDADAEAERVFGEGLTGTLVTIAKDVKLQVEFDATRVAGYRLIGYERRVMKTEEFRDDAKDSGEVGAGHAVTALYELVPAGRPVPGAEAPTVTEVGGSRPSANLLEVALRYKAPWAEAAREFRYPLSAAATATANLRFAAAVALFGMVLAESGHTNGTGLDRVVELAADNLGADPRGERRAFVELARKTAGFVGQALESRRAQVAAARARNARELAAWKVAQERERAQRKGIEWLAKLPQPEGRAQRAGAGPVGEVGLDGAVLLAFLADGNTLRTGPHKDLVKAYVKWLRRLQGEDGAFRAADGEVAPLDQAIAALGIVEAYGLSSYKLVKRNAERAARYNATHPASDPQVLAWQILVDEASRHFGVGADNAGLKRAARAALGRPDGPEHDALTLLTRLVLEGQALREGEPTPPAADRIVSRPPTGERLAAVDPGTWFLSSDAVERVGGGHLEQWAGHFPKALEGPQGSDGSWQPAGGSSGDRGRIYTTAALVKCLAAVRRAANAPR